MRSFFKKLIIFLIVLTFSPVATLADDEDPSMGTVIINVQDKNGDDVSGNWLLHHMNVKGMIVRNGMKSDEFGMDDGTYFLEVRNTSYYEAYVIDEDKTQTLEPGGNITYNITYYRTEEDMYTTDDPETDEPAEESESDEETTPDPEAEPPTEEPAEESESDEETTPEPLAGPTPEPVEPIVGTYYVYAPAFDTPPDTTSAPAASDSEEYDLGDVTVLATTGPALLFLLIPSAFGGLYLAVRRKK